MSRPNTKPTKKRGPLRIIIRCAWSGSRLTVPPEGLTLKSTLADVISRLSLPPLTSGATLVCLRKLAVRSEWDGTTLGMMLDGDDGGAGILLTLDLGQKIDGDVKPSEDKTVIEKAAESLNIKPEPMEISDNSQHQPQQPKSADNVSQITQTTPATAWTTVLQSNFDSTSKSCLLTLLKIIDNLLSRPGDVKVRSIRCANVNFQQKVGNCKGGLEFMYSLGFEPNYPAFGSREPESLELKDKENKNVLLMGREALILSAQRDFGMEEDELPKMPVTPAVVVSAPSTAAAAATTARSTSQGFDIYKGHSINIQAQQMGAPDPYADKSISTTERQLQNLEAKKKNLEKQLQSTVEVDRYLVAYLPGDGPVGISSSGAVTETKGDSSLVAARMKRMEEERKKREEGGFTTKAMRDLERMKKAKVYSHAQIRINFPDGTHLHGRFLPTENISRIRSIIQSSLSPDCQSDFDLYVAPPRRLLNDTKSLEEEELVPAAKIHVSWKSNPNNTVVGGFLRSELFNANNNVSAFPEAKPIVPEKRAQPSNASGSNGNDDGPSKEEMLMARMMGKGLVGAKKTSKSVGGSDQGENKGGKPKWFK